MEDPTKSSLSGDLPLPLPEPAPQAPAPLEEMSFVEKIFDLPNFADEEAEVIFDIPLDAPVAPVAPAPAEPAPVAPTAVAPLEQPEPFEVKGESVLDVQKELIRKPLNLDQKPRVDPSSQSPERVQQLQIIADDRYDNRVKDPLISSYVEGIINEANSREFSRPQNERYRKESKETYKKTAEEIYRNNILSTGESKPLMDIISDLESQKQTPFGFRDPYSPMPLEYGRNLIQEELMTSDLSVELKSQIYAEYETQMKEKYPDPTTVEGATTRLDEAISNPETYMIDTSSIPMGQTVSGDITKSLAGTTKLVGAPLALLVGGISSFSPDRYYVADEKPLKPLENFALGLPLTTNLLNYRESGNLASVEPGEIVSQLKEGKAPRVNEQAFKDATELSLRGKVIKTDEGRFSVPVYSAADVISIHNNIADNSERIKSKIGQLLFSDPTKAFYLNPSSGVPLQEQANAFRKNPAYHELVNRLYNKYAGVWFYEDDVVTSLPSEDEKYINVFSEFFSEPTISSEIAEIIDKASTAVFDRGIIQEAFPLNLEGLKRDAELGAIAAGPGRAELLELLSAVPEKDREKIVGLLFGNENFQLTQGAFTGDLTEDLKNQRAMFKTLAARYTQVKSDEQISELVATGAFGKKWEGSHLSPEERALYHKAVPVLLAIEQIAQSPEFQDDSEAFFSIVGEGLSMLPHHVNVSAAGVLNAMGADYGSDQLKEQGRIKIEDDLPLVLADFAMLSALAGKAGQRFLLKKSPETIVLDSFAQIEGPSSIIKTANENIPPANRNPGGFKTVDEVAKSPVTPTDAIVLDTAVDPVTGLYKVPSSPPVNTTVKGQVMLRPEHSYFGYRREIASIDNQLAELPPQSSAERRSLEVRKEELEKLINVNRSHHQEDLEFTVQTNVESPATESVEPQQRQIQFKNKKALEDIQQEGFTKYDLDQPPDSFPRTVGIAEEEVTYTINRDLQNPDGSKRYASTNKDNEIVLNPVVNLDNFFNYFEGNYTGPTSMQKKLVLEKLAEEGIYTPEEIRSIIATPKDANQFLLLHELDHVFNNDRANYWNQGKDLLTEDKIKIEKRATERALTRLKMSQKGVPLNVSGEFEPLYSDLQKYYKQNEDWITETPSQAVTENLASSAGIDLKGLPPTLKQVEKIAHHMVKTGNQKLGDWLSLFEVSDTANLVTPRYYSPGANKVAGIVGSEKSFREARIKRARSGKPPEYIYDIAHYMLAAKRKLTVADRFRNPDELARVQFTQQSVARRLDMFDRLSLQSDKAASLEYKREIARATRALDKMASFSNGFRIGNYTTAEGAERMIRALQSNNVKDPIIWKVLFDRSVFGSVKNSVVGRYIGEIVESQHKQGTDARLQAMQEIDTFGPALKDGPVAILSKETKQNARIVNDRLDSLTIAQKLAMSGDDRPSSYFGLNLTNQEMSGFMGEARRNSQKVAIIRKVKDENTGLRLANEGGLFAENFDQGGISGIKVGVSPQTHALTPEKIVGIPQDSLLQRFGRVSGRVILGDKGYNFINEARRTQSLRYSALAATEAMQRPFAFANLPKWYRLGVSEMVLHARASGWSGWSGSMARHLFEGMATGSYTLGDEMYHALKTREGDFHLDIRALDKQFSDPLDNFIVTDAKVKEVFGKLQSLKGDSVVFDRIEIHQLGHIIHRNLTDVKIVDPRSLKGGEPPKVYTLSKIIEPVVNVKSLLQEELSFIDKKLKTIAKTKRNAENTQILDARTNALVRQRNLIAQRIESGNVVSKTDSVFPDLRQLKKDYDAASQYGAKQPIQAAILKDQIEIYSQFTNDVVSQNINGLKYRLVKPANSMDDFEKSLVVLAQQAVVPRVNYIFDLIVQLVVGEDTVKLMFDSGKGFQNIVAKTVVSKDGSIKYDVVKEFPSNFDGQLAATAYRNKLASKPGPLNITSKTSAQTGDLLEEITPSELTARATLESVGDYVTVTQDTLSQSLSPSPRPPKKGREFSVLGTELINRSMNWLSTFYETEKLRVLVTDIALAASQKQIPAQEIQLQMKRLAKAVLSGIDGGKFLIEKHGGDEAKALNELLEMSPKKVEKMFGGALRENERFFIEQAYRKNFNNAHFLQILSDYNTSFFKTSTEILNNIHQLKLVNKFRSETKILTESEWQTLPKGLQRQWVKADEVLSKPGDAPVFSSTLSGARVHINVAEHFARQVGLQKMQDLSLAENARPMKRFLNSVSQYSKVNLLLDVINNTVLRNKLGAMLVQSVAHADYIMNPTYLTRSIKFIRGIEKGTIDINTLPPKFIEAMKMYTSGSTSLKAEFYKTKQGRLWRDLALDAGDFAARQNLPKLINDVDSPDALKAIENLANVLSLKGFDKNITGFFEALRTQDIDAVAPEFLGSENLGAALDKIGVAREGFLNFYSSIDGWYKTAYQWYLMESKGMPAPLAFKESNKTYVDYGDMSPLINFFRFGGGHAGYSMFTNEFIAFGAQQVPNHWDMITNKPIRSFILGHLSEAYDRAVDETIKFAYTTEELRHLFRDPTLRMTLIRPEAEATTGLERGPKMEMVGGLPYMYSGQSMTGAPSAMPGLESLGPLLPFDSKSLYYGTPMKNDYMTTEDIPKIFSNFFRIFGGAFNSIAESSEQRSSARKQDLKLRLELGQEYETFEEVDKKDPGNAVWNSLYRRLAPRIFQSAAQLASGIVGEPVLGEMKSRSSAYGSLLGYSGRQVNLNNILDTDIIPKNYRRSLKSKVEAWEETITEDSPRGDYEQAAIVINEFDNLERSITLDRERLDLAQLEALEDIRLAVLAKMLEGEITFDELMDVYNDIQKAQQE